MNYLAWLTLYLLLINALAFLFMLVDKYRAKHYKWRIPEATLLTLAFLGGSLGAALGMLLAHHKTRKPKFYVLVPLFLVLHLVILFFLLR